MNELINVLNDYPFLYVLVVFGGYGCFKILSCIFWKIVNFIKFLNKLHCLLLELPYDRLMRIFSAAGKLHNWDLKSDINSLREQIETLNRRFVVQEKTYIPKGYKAKYTDQKWYETVKKEYGHIEGGEVQK